MFTVINFAKKGARYHNITILWTRKIPPWIGWAQSFVDDTQTQRFTVADFDQPELGSGNLPSGHGYQPIWAVFQNPCFLTVPPWKWSETKHDGENHVSHEKKKLITFHYTGWLIGIPIMVYYNPCIYNIYIYLGSIIPYITQPTTVFSLLHVCILSTILYMSISLKLVTPKPFIPNSNASYFILSHSNDLFLYHSDSHLIPNIISGTTS